MYFFWFIFTISYHVASGGFSTHRTVVILWADVTAFLAPVDLVGATAADLTQSLMGSLVHACPKPDITWITSFSNMSCSSH